MTYATPIDFYHAVKHAWSAETVCGAFDPAKPTPPDSFVMAPSAARSNAALRGN